MSNDKVAATFHPDDGPRWTCRTCHTIERVLEEHDEEIGRPDNPIPITVLNLGCGHEAHLARGRD